MASAGTAVDEEDEEAAGAVAWEAFGRRNASIVTRLFMGQQLCRTACPTPGCGYVSRRFEELMYLPLPLPTVTQTWRLTVVASAAVQARAAGIHTEPLIEVAEAAEGGDVPTVNWDAMPVASRHTVVLPTTATVGDLKAALAPAVARQLVAAGALPRDPGATAPAPYVLVVLAMRSGVWERLMVDAAPLRGWRSRDIMVYLLPPPPTVPWQILAVYSRHRVWNAETVGYPRAPADAATCRQPADAAATTSNDDDNRPTWRRVSTAAECWDLPTAFPNFFQDVRVPAAGVPLLVRLVAGATLGELRDVARLWASLLWSVRDGVVGAGMGEAFMPAADRGTTASPPSLPAPPPPPLADHAPRMVWLSPYGVCAGCSTYACTGCLPLPALPPAAVVAAARLMPAGVPPPAPVSSSDADAAATPDDAAVWSTPLAVGPTNEIPGAVGLEWFSADDRPRNADTIGLNRVWGAYTALAAQRAALLPAARAALSDAPTAADAAAAAASAAATGKAPPVAYLPDPMSVVPHAVVASYVRGMTFAPATVEVVEGDSSGGGGGRERAATDATTEATLETCFDLNNEHAALSDDNLWACPRCTHRVAAMRSTYLTRAPEVMVIVLKRFVFRDAYGGMDKVDTLVDFPLTGLDLSGWTHRAGAAAAAAAAGDRPPLLYDLFGVCHHTGTLTMGHYTASTRHPHSGAWYLYNDNFVRPLLPATGGAPLTPEREDAALRDALVTPAAYVLMYRRRR